MFNSEFHAHQHSKDVIRVFECAEHVRSPRLRGFLGATFGPPERTARFEMRRAADGRTYEIRLTSGVAPFSVRLPYSLSDAKLTSYFVNIGDLGALTEVLAAVVTHLWSGA